MKYRLRLGGEGCRHTSRLSTGEEVMNPSWGEIPRNFSSRSSRFPLAHDLGPDRTGDFILPVGYPACQFFFESSKTTGMVMSTMSKAGGAANW